jgi:hypothetical protein
VACAKRRPGHSGTTKDKGDTITCSTLVIIAPIFLLNMLQKSKSRTSAMKLANSMSTSVWTQSKVSPPSAGTHSLWPSKMRLSDGAIPVYNSGNHNLDGPLSTIFPHAARSDLNKLRPSRSLSYERFGITILYPSRLSSQLISAHSSVRRFSLAPSEREPRPPL